MCCGCSACLQVCPAACISWTEDGEGFLYPVVDLDRCLHCDVCEDVCPMLHPLPAEEPLDIIGAKNPDEGVRAASSSGGLFSMLADKTLSEGGVVFGAAFDEEWTVEHVACENTGELARLRGSKYLQSLMGDTFREIKKILTEDRPVLFCGTSCQAAGLRRLLGREPKLLVADVVCHSIPSPKVWKQYLNEKAAAKGYAASDITRLTFRDKTLGWKDFSVVAVTVDASGKEQEIIRETSRENAYMRGFLKGLYSRPACSNCPAKRFTSGADITIADFWGAYEFYPAQDDDRGITLAFALTGKGNETLASLGLDTINVTLMQATKHNPRIMSPAEPHPQRDEVFENLGKTHVEDMVWKYAKPSLKQKITGRLKRK